MPVYETTEPVYKPHPRGPFTGMIVKIESAENSFNPDQPRLLWRIESDLAREDGKSNYTLVRYTSTSRHAKSSLPPWIRELGGEDAWAHVLAHGLDTDEWEGLRVSGYVKHKTLEDGRVRDEISDISLDANPFKAPEPAKKPRLKTPAERAAEEPQPVPAGRTTATATADDDDEDGDPFAEE